MVQDSNAVASVADMLVRALERAAKLYETRVFAADTYDTKLTEDGVRLATALDRLRKAMEEIAMHEDGRATAQNEAKTRELLMRLEKEIEATIAERVAAFAESIPVKCPQCGAQLPELAPA
ncbi:MAG: hypothetical protein AAFY99_11195 [Pseudomonadota bacterium]